jgi:hypothetical protein
MADPQLEAAAAFVNREGTAVEKARLRYLMTGEQPGEDVAAPFVTSQKGDGGWEPYWAPDYTSIDATCYQLAQAEQAGFDRLTPFIVDAVRFLAERQRPDGSWEEEPREGANPPFWARPGDPEARLYLTANAGYWLARTRLVPSGARDAAVFLASRTIDAGRLPSFSQTHWLAAALWHSQGMTDEATGALDHLIGQIPDMSAGNLAWLLIAFDGGGIPHDHPVALAAAERLRGLRLPDGSWQEDEAAGNAVHVTLEALRALKLAG